MKKLNGKKSDLTDRLFFENMVNANKVLSFALMLLGLTFVGIAFADNFDFFDVGNLFIRAIILCSGLVDISVYIIVRLQHYDRYWHKMGIIYSTLISSTVVFFYFPLNATFIFYGPILMSAMYYSQVQIRKTSFLSWVLYSLALWANVVLEAKSEAMQAWHAWVKVEIWKYPMEVLSYRYIIHSIEFFITALICNGIAKRGKNLVLKQSQITAEVTAMEADLKIASNIQLESLPAQSYSTSDGKIRINALIRPAKMVGGDFYDYFICGQDIVFLVADVSDKGLPSAMFMMKAKNTIRSAVLNGESLEKSIATANNTLCRNNDENTFVTLWIASINKTTGIGTYINAGHVNPLLRHADGTVTKIENTPNVMLGVFADAQFQPHAIQLEKDDTLFVFSDGLTDAENDSKEFLGNERLMQYVQSLPPDTDNFCNALIDRIDEFASKQNQFDDMTLLTVCIKNCKTSAQNQLYLDANYESVEKMIDIANSMLAECGCPDDVRRNIDTALDEIGANICDYAYPDGNGKFTASFAVIRNTFDITICDKGPRFNPLEHISNVKANSLSTDGLGIMLVKKLMDTMEYSWQDNENRLRLTKSWQIAD